MSFHWLLLAGHLAAAHPSAHCLQILSCDFCFLKQTLHSSASQALYTNPSSGEVTWSSIQMPEASFGNKLWIQLCLFLKHFSSWISATFSGPVIPTGQNGQHRGSGKWGLLTRACSCPAAGLGVQRGWYKDSSLRSTPLSQGHLFHTGTCPIWTPLPAQPGPPPDPRAYPRRKPPQTLWLSAT